MDTMSGTPRIDRMATTAGSFDPWTIVVTIQSARNLERELNSTTQAFSDYMTKTTIETNDLRHEIGNLRQHIELLKASK